MSIVREEMSYYQTLMDECSAVETKLKEHVDEIRARATQRIMRDSKAGNRIGFTTEVYHSGDLVRRGRVVWLRNLEQNDLQHIPLDRLFALGTAITDLGYIFVLDSKGMGRDCRVSIQKYYREHGGYTLIYTPAEGAEPEGLFIQIPATLAGTFLHHALKYLKALDEEEERMWAAYSNLEPLHAAVVDEYRPYFQWEGIDAMDKATKFHLWDALTQMAAQHLLAKNLTLIALKMESQKCPGLASDL